MEAMGSIMVDDLLLEDEVPPAMSMSPGGGGSPSATSAAAPAAAAGGVSSDDESAAADLRRGPWTVEEDALLVHHIAAHGEGRWNALARAAGLRRTGKSCRLRWLNYLRPDVRRGNITPREQLLILDLHSRWGNRWSKIALHLPGRTDNEIKNYWRTRVQKHARQLRCDVNSVRFRDVVRRVWMPRLVERIQAEDEAAAGGGGAAHHLPSVKMAAASAPPACPRMPLRSGVHGAEDCYYTYSDPAAAAAAAGQTTPPALSPDDNASSAPHSSLTMDAASHYSCYTTSATATTPTNEGCGGGGDASRATTTDGDVLGGSWSELLATAGRDDDGDSSMSMVGLPDFAGWFGDLEDSSSLWSLEDLCLHQLC
ncbi:hypothetical protein U9M48_041805 [Paspalum notatum var. saurae]|uniref:Uncharacterized protein n=1 Tax=Paspalum notatum var. saurae TaxID=547442 RepID=A0AAQ3XGY1_PASNO